MQTGEVRKYGTNRHDSLSISDDGRCLYYRNLQNGDGSQYGDYRFCDEDGKLPEENDAMMLYGADMYANIGGFRNEQGGELS